MDYLKLINLEITALFAKKQNLIDEINIKKDLLEVNTANYLNKSTFSNLEDISLIIEKLKEYHQDIKIINEKIDLLKNTGGLI